MTFLKKSKVQQIEDALKSNANLSRRADTMLKDKSVDSKFQRFLVEDQKRLNKERKDLTRMLKDTNKKNK